MWAADCFAGLKADNTLAAPVRWPTTVRKASRFAFCSLEDVAAVCSWQGNTIRRNALAVRSLLEMTGNQAKGRTVSWHSLSSHVRIGLHDRKASGVADEFAALYNPLESSSSHVIGGLLIWEQPLVSGRRQ